MFNTSFAIILMGKRELVALHNLSSWYLVIIVCLFPAVPRLYLQFVIVVHLFPDHTHYFDSLEFSVMNVVLVVEGMHFVKDPYNHYRKQEAR